MTGPSVSFSRRAIVSLLRRSIISLSCFTIFSLFSRSEGLHARVFEGIVENELQGDEAVEAGIFSRSMSYLDVRIAACR